MRCFFSLLLGVEARAQSSPLKDKHPSSYGFVFLLLYQLTHRTIEQNNSRGVALPTFSLLAVCLFFHHHIPLYLGSCTATRPTPLILPPPPLAFVGGGVGTNVECLVTSIRYRNFVCRRRRSRQLKYFAKFLICAWCLLRCVGFVATCQPLQLFAVLLCARQGGQLPDIANPTRTFAV